MIGKNKVDVIQKEHTPRRSLDRRRRRRRRRRAPHIRARTTASGTPHDARYGLLVLGDDGDDDGDDARERQGWSRIIVWRRRGDAAANRVDDGDDDDDARERAMRGDSW